MSPDPIPALIDVSIPQSLKIDRRTSMEGLMADIGRKSLAGHNGPALWGMAFIQGNRLQFTTAMPLAQLIGLTQTNVAKKGSSVSEIVEHTNRPTEKAHAKALKGYLLGTACKAEPFILPSFTLNLGVQVDEGQPDATLMLFDNGDNGAKFWPAVLFIPNSLKLDVTDGAHRRNVGSDILRQDDENATNLRENCVDVKIVFEDKAQSAHQDFADCAKAKPITQSTVVAWDVRDARNLRSGKLAADVPFLHRYVDATASNVNLSAKSKKIWSLSAVKLYVNHVFEHQATRTNGDMGEATSGSEEFFAALIRHLPQFKLLDAAEPKVTVGQLREVSGGDVSLRAAGMGIFARAFLYCQEHKMSYEEMAMRLAKLEWTVLTVDRDKIPVDSAYQQAVISAARPVWRSLLSVAEKRYRIATADAFLNEAWTRIKAELGLPDPLQLAA